MIRISWAASLGVIHADMKGGRASGSIPGDNHTGLPLLPEASRDHLPL